MKKNVRKYLKDYKFKSLLVKIFICVIVGILLPLLISISLNYHKYDREINRRMKEMNDEILQRSAVVIENLIDSFFKMVDKLAEDENVKYIMEIEDLLLEKSECVLNSEILISEYSEMNIYIQNEVLIILYLCKMVLNFIPKRFQSYQF